MFVARQWECRTTPSEALCLRWVLPKQEKRGLSTTSHPIACARCQVHEPDFVLGAKPVPRSSKLQQHRMHRAHGAAMRPCASHTSGMASRRVFASPISMPCSDRLPQSRSDIEPRGSLKPDKGRVGFGENHRSLVSRLRPEDGQRRQARGLERPETVEHWQSHGQRKIGHNDERCAWS